MGLSWTKAIALFAGIAFFCVGVVLIYQVVLSALFLDRQQRARNAYVSPFNVPNENEKAARDRGLSLDRSTISYWYTTIASEVHAGTAVASAATAIAATVISATVIISTIAYRHTTIAGEVHAGTAVRRAAIAITIAIAKSATVIVSTIAYWHTTIASEVHAGTAIDACGGRFD
ncbi:MAG: hypothetical protein K8F62_07275 [Pseudorhodoplanes sp.]|nr:hypothetical protein [Pseudorhodoplanes sp.]